MKFYHFLVRLQVLNLGDVNIKNQKFLDKFIKMAIDAFFTIP